MRFLTAGESHGPKLTAIIEGVPANLAISTDDINQELARRQLGYGRGNRMKIETDQVEITSGVRHGKTLGSPITLVVENHDWVNWEKAMSSDASDLSYAKERMIANPRPGHADLVGGIKYGHRDLRNVLERSSARETAMRVAVGAVAKKVLSCLGIEIYSSVVELGGVKADIPADFDIAGNVALIEASPVRCADRVAAEAMIAAIDQAKLVGDTLGGIFEVVVTGMPVGVGSYAQYDRKLDAKLAAAMLSIQAIKGVEFGIGFEAGRLPGSLVQDEMIWDEVNGYRRKTNRLGGLEGSMTTGEPLVMRAVMKPIATLYQPLQSVNIETKEMTLASVERSDTCAVPAASVVAENVIAWELAQTIVDQFYSDTLETLTTSVANLRKFAREF